MPVSVILVNWNGQELLPEALASLPDGLDVWVVDNGSSDDSIAYLKQNHPHVHIIANPQNRGFGRANNQALRLITSDYVLMLNTDARLVPGALDKALAYMNAHPQVSLLGARLLNSDGSLQNSVTHKVDLTSECVNRNLISWWRGEKRKEYNIPTEVPGIVGAAMLGRMSHLKAVDFFDEDYFFFFEETDLCFRLNAQKTPVVHHPEFEVTHAQGKSASKNKINARIEYHRSRELFFFKHIGRLAAKKLQLWQERRLIVSHWSHLILKILSLGLYTPRKYELTKALRHWYKMGCPTNQGLNPANQAIIEPSSNDIPYG